MLAVGGADDMSSDEVDALPPDELFDEASGRWFELPHPMIEPRSSICRVVSLPAAALAPAAVAAAGEAVAQ